MKKNEDVRPEYDFSSMKCGVRGKYVSAVRERTNIVLLDPDVAEAFPSEAAVNEALRGVLNTTRAIRRSGGLPNRTLSPAAPSGPQGSPRAKREPRRAHS